MVDQPPKSLASSLGRLIAIVLIVMGWLVVIGLTSYITARYRRQAVAPTVVSVENDVGIELLYQRVIQWNRSHK